MILVGLAMPVLFGVAGLAVDGTNWHSTRRAMQNAADAAAVAASTNGTSNYLAEARAVARQYGFVDGTDNTTVTASNTATCPSGGTTCYSVTITKNVKLVFAQIVGFSGNATTTDGAKAEALSVTAVATQGPTIHDYCLIALGDGSGADNIITANGAPKANLSGCGVASKESMRCNGHDLGADYGDAIGTNSGCGDVQNSNVSTINDPYVGLNANVPANPCSTYPGATWNTDKTLSGTTSICGTLSVTSDVTLSGTGVVIIYNGDLDVDARVTLKTASGAGVTFIFAGTSSSTVSHAFTGGKNTLFDLAAPTSGTWSGVVMYQVPSLTQNVDMTFNGNGNTPTFNLKGVVYMPNASVTLSGAANKDTDTSACLIFVVKQVTFNGGGYTANRTNCKAAGATLPTGTLIGRGMLVD